MEIQVLIEEDRDSRFSFSLCILLNVNTILFSAPETDLGAKHMTTSILIAPINNIVYFLD